MNANDLRPGMIIRHNNDLFTIYKAEHRMPGNLRAFVQAKMRNLRTGSMIDHRFRSEDTVERAERHSGQSEYSLRKLLELTPDGIFAFSIVPLRAAILSGTFAVALSVLFALYSIYAKLFLNRSPQGFTALVLLITFLCGILLFFIGIIGEYIGRLYEEVKARPLYIIGKSVGWPPPHTSPTPAAKTAVH